MIRAQHLEHELAGRCDAQSRQKGVMSHLDFLEILKYHWSEDPGVYADERQRVQFAMLLLVHAFTAARPCSTATFPNDRRKTLSAPRTTRIVTTQ